MRTANGELSVENDASRRPEGFGAPKGRTSHLPRVKRSGTRGPPGHREDQLVLAQRSTGFAALHPWQFSGAALRDANGSPVEAEELHLLGLRRTLDANGERSKERRE